MAQIDRSQRSVLAKTSSAAPLLTRHAAVYPILDFKTHCPECNMREMCLPVSLDPDALRAFDAMVTWRRWFKKGKKLYCAGDPFTELYAIRVGSCKTVILAEDGREQIIGYHMLGEIIGMDGVSAERHACEAIALEDTEVCALPFDLLEQLSRTFPALQHSVLRLLSRDIGRDEHMMLALGSMHVEERLAGFLLDLSERYRRRGYSANEYVLRMTREEIGSYLGMKLETVSRLLSRFQEAGLLQVQGRNVKLFDLVSLKQLAGHHC